MNTTEHNKTYLILILLSLVLEATRVAGAMTEVLIFLFFVIHEFVLFYLENNPKLTTALAPIPANSIDLKKERNTKHD